MRTGVKWGVILGVAICLWTLMLHVLGWYTVDIANGERADIAAIILPVLAIGLAIRERRSRNPGQSLSIMEGMTTGMLVGLVSIPISAGFLWFYHHQVNPDWVTHLVNYHTRTMAAAGATAQAIAEKVRALRSGGQDAAQLTGALVGTIILSAILSLIFSLALRRRATPA
jgi:uncharacterized membrane protein YkvI